jgi:hypothetical protein
MKEEMRENKRRKKGQRQRKTITRREKERGAKEIKTTKT